MMTDEFRRAIDRKPARREFWYWALSTVLLVVLGALAGAMS